MKKFEGFNRKYGSIIQNIYDENFCGILDNEVYRSIISISIMEAEKNASNFSDFYSYFLKFFIEYIKPYLGNILEEPINALVVLSNYMEREVKIPLSYDEAVIELKKVTRFLNIIYDSYTFLHYQVFLDNHELSKMLQFVFDKNIIAIKEGKIDTLFEDKILKNLLQAYCSDKNIGIIYVNDIDKAQYKLSDAIFLTDFTKQYISSLEDSLPEEEINDLLVRASNGDRKAIENILIHNSRLVTSIASKYHYYCNSLELLELIQVGNMGLLKAIEKFDFAKNCKFGTYATWWIRHYIVRTISDLDDMIRIPVWLYEELYRYRRTKEMLEEKLARKATKVEIAMAMKLSLNKINEYENIPEVLLSLNETIGDSDEDREVYEIIPSDSCELLEDEIINNGMIDEFLRILNSIENISEKEKDVLCLHLGLTGPKKSLREIGEKYGITYQAVSAIVARALKKFRQSKEAEAFTIYADNPDEALLMLRR